MARGALVRSGVVVDVFEAASDLCLNYDGEGGAFIPSDDAEIGDLWDGSRFALHHVPSEITALQARRVLNATGLRATVDAAVSAADQDTKDAWEYAGAIHRDNLIITGMAKQLGMSSSQVDDLFRAGAKL